MANFDSNASTSEGCSKCYKPDVNACLTNIAKIEDHIKAKDTKIKRLNMVVREGYEGKNKEKSKAKYDGGRHKSIKDGLGHKRA